VEGEACTVACQQSLNPNPPKTPNGPHSYDVCHTHTHKSKIQVTHYRSSLHPRPALAVTRRHPQIRNSNYCLVLESWYDLHHYRPGLHS
jgi:hypothetical protein